MTDLYKLFMKRCVSRHPYDDNRHVLKRYEIKQGLRLISRRYGIDKVYLFGSYAYGNPDRFSDLNLLIAYGTCNGLNRIAYLDDLERYFRKGIDAVNIRSMGAILKADVRERAVIVYDQLWQR